MRFVVFFWCLMVQTLFAQSGFNKGYSIGYNFNEIYDVVVQGDTIIAYGTGLDSLAGFQKGVFVARFDTLGNLIDQSIMLDSTNNVYDVDKHWGKIIQTSDGGFAMTTTTLFGRDAIFIKVNNLLEVEFVQKYRDTINIGEFLVAPVEIPDGYLLYGYYNHEGNAKFNAVLRKVDKQGNMIWRKNFGVYNRHESFYKAEPWGDSLLVISGQDVFDVFEPEYSRPWVSVFNYQGELQWDWTSVTATPYDGIIMAWFYPQPDSSWLAYGSKPIGTHPQYGWDRYQSYWVKLDKNFQFQWAKAFGPNTGYVARFIKVLKAPNGDYIGVGERGPYELFPDSYFKNGWVMRFSPEADSLWAWTGKLPISNPGGHFLAGADLLSSGSIIAGGSGEGENGYPYCWLVKLTPDGCVDTLFCNSTSSVQYFQDDGHKLQIFPNPADDNIQILGIPNAANKVAIFDIMGHLIYSTTIEDAGETLELFTQGYSSGIYFCRFLQNGKIVGSSKFVVQH